MGYHLRDQSVQRMSLVREEMEGPVQLHVATQQQGRSEGTKPGLSGEASAQAMKQKQHKTTHPLLRSPRASKKTCYIEHLYSALSRAERM